MRDLRSAASLGLGFAFLRVVQAGGEDFHRLRLLVQLAGCPSVFDHHAQGRWVMRTAESVLLMPARAGCAKGVDARAWLGSVSTAPSSSSALRA